MERLPDPPTSFGVPPVTRMLRSGSRLWRIYFRGGKHPTLWNGFRMFGPTGSRFDHHTYPKRTQARGILYATFGENPILTALAEVFQDTRYIDISRNEPWLAAFELAKEVILLDTESEWPNRAGGCMAINSGSRNQARKWSRAIYREYVDVHGIYYPSSLTNQPCVALYERVTSVLPKRPEFNEPIDSRKLSAPLTHLAAELNYLCFI